MQQNQSPVYSVVSTDSSGDNNNTNKLGQYSSAANVSNIVATNPSAPYMSPMHSVSGFHSSMPNMLPIGGLYDMQNTSNGFGMYNSNLNTQNSLLSNNLQLYTVETNPLDCSMVTSPTDVILLQKVNASIITIDKKVPLFIEKKINDTGNEYSITFTWNEDWWDIDMKKINSKILSIMGVKNVKIGHKQLTVIVKKSRNIEEEIKNNNDVLGTLFSENRELSKQLYEPKSETDIKVLEYVKHYMPDVSQFKKALFYDIVRSKIASRNSNRSKKSKNKKGVSKNKKNKKRISKTK